VATVGSGNATGWHTYSFTAAATGSLELALGMMSVGDTQLNSHLLVDDIRVNGASPYVPATEGVPIPLDMSALLTDADGSETLVVDISSLPAGALLSSGTDLGGGHWALTGAQLAGLTLTTPQDFTGLFTVNAAARATEASNGDVAAVSKDFTIMVNPANHAPVAASDAAATNEDSTVLVNVLANDTDSNGDLLTIASLFGATSAQGATLSIVNGQVLYDPSTSAALQALDRGQSLTDTFSYMASDGRGGTATAQASVEVAGVHDGMQGVALDYAYLFPDGTSPIFETQVVPGAGIELDGLYGEYTPGRLDLTDDRIIVDFLSDGTATAADFNGFHLSDHAGALPAILDVTVAQNTIAGFTDARITHDANNVFVNLQGLQYDASSHLELQVVF
ncbi:MAG TPA: Ig-like domain-containing protein, partial [Burkholderiales bacterium]|nr:Ig-like domain-containing protein [Burkholderiales bacterium]